MSRLVDLLNAYGRAKFGDEWWPGNPSGFLPEDQANELLDLLEQEDFADATNARLQQEQAERKAYQAQLDEIRRALNRSRHEAYNARGDRGSGPFHCYGCDRTEPTLFDFLDTCCLGHALQLGELRARHEDGEHDYLVSGTIGGVVTSPTNVYEHKCPLCIEEAHLARAKQP